uniref:Uncharacterized protein n=1 Tax=Arundo donax TaxID=35708 RepID=A0A0A9DI67_ARUDO
MTKMKKKEEDEAKEEEREALAPSFTTATGGPGHPAKSDRATCWSGLEKLLLMLWGCFLRVVQILFAVCVVMGGVKYEILHHRHIQVCLPFLASPLGIVGTCSCQFFPSSFGMYHYLLIEQMGSTFFCHLRHGK